MRARETMAKLDRLEPKDDDEIRLWDLSLLSPEDQDRANELLNVISEAVDKDDATGIEMVMDEFEDLVRDLPMLGRDDPQQGPTIEVPAELASYWRWRQPASRWRPLSFWNLTKVDTVRFVQLCGKYGYEHGRGAYALSAHMMPLDQWRADDRAELQEMLAIAMK